ncbi:DAO-domain-containing protein [Gloeophyllum trabeum ATCC 11539]|uniref:DAO-domain-containing protein n=1 Tax=Gloeophyllum trabeum (strain ATCC 11539 / FP-39264 / Madison 617) TaxID=670483 RepID=S7QNQ6_GLOTA|nr:DAO-domain-containing protein [Gloeophyllum trabeum ATCC 11539]EPQ61158.1 DAO-domain-containing protein [Gloeophyllum trabeum ATCC 11539]
MGHTVSKLRLAWKELVRLVHIYDDVYKRLQASPGVPDTSNPTTRSFWTVPESPISTHILKELPEYADIVIVGSGITGTSVAYNVLDFVPTGSLTIVMLEAREACSGATARNGGHINPPLWHDYADLKEVYGEKEAKTIMQFRLAHLREMMSVAASESIAGHCQIREVETVDVYFDDARFGAAKEAFKLWQTDMSADNDSFYPVEKENAIKDFGLANEVAGCIIGAAGAVHPYRFVTSILSNLLKRHPDHFFLSTHTPCTDVHTSARGYTVVTPRGMITTPHVVHATNGWASHLLEPLRAKIVPIRGNMTAQRPGQSLARSTRDGYRAHIFYRDQGYDYLTQLPDGEHELMFGGGFAQANKNGLSEIADMDDGSLNWGITNNLGGALPLYFGPSNWGAEAVPSKSSDRDEVDWPQGRMKAFWTGILGISVDGRPWVGRLPPRSTGRRRPLPLPDKSRLTSVPSEWISAGYSGEGMPHAWMSGKGLAYMVLGVEKETCLSEWFPQSFIVSEQRRRKAKVEDLLDRFRK